MYTSFNQLSGQAHIWIYQANRQLATEEIAAILQKSKAFLEAWTSHGRPLQCGAEVLHNRFLVFAIERSTQELSCCTVDSAIHFLRELKDTLQLDLLDRTNVVFKQGDAIFTVPLDQVKEKIQQGEILADMLMFDNTITHKAALADKWLVPAKDSWLGKYVPQPMLSRT